MENARQPTGLKREKEVAIFDAACSVIREKGYHQARITDIAQRAGISYGLVYHYFKSKSDLFDAILKEWSNGLFSMMERFNGQSVTVEVKLTAIVNYFLDQYEKRPDLVHIFITEFSRSSANMTPERVEMLRAFTRKTEEIIASGQNEKTLRDDIRPKYLMYVFLGAIEIFFSILVHENRPLKGRSQKQQFSQALMELFLKGAKAA
jgi:TetR/AcrR family transcriptional regulator, fatty acid metabolism regulator protein